MDQWRGKVAFITGASSGIGAEIAMRLVKEGMIVVGVARKIENIQKLSTEYKNFPGKLYAHKMDLSIEQDIINAITWTINNVGPISILFNNATISLNTNLLNGNVEFWNRTLMGNIIGVTLCTKLVVRNMIDNNIDGHIVFTGDIVCHNIYYRNDFNVYSASRFAFVNLLECWRQELLQMGSKIKTSIISPGVVKTGGFDNFSPEAQKWFNTVPHLLPSDLADTALFVITRPPHCQVYQTIIKPLGEKEL